MNVSNITSKKLESIIPMSYQILSFQVYRNSHKNVTMSGGLDVLSLKDTDVSKLLAATSHLGSENVNFQMEQYVFKRRPDGVHIINLGRTWEKLLLAARVIASVEHAQEVSYWDIWEFLWIKMMILNNYHLSGLITADA